MTVLSSSTAGATLSDTRNLCDRIGNQKLAMLYVFTLVSAASAAFLAPGAMHVSAPVARVGNVDMIGKVNRPKPKERLGGAGAADAKGVSKVSLFGVFNGAFAPRDRPLEVSIAPFPSPRSARFLHGKTTHRNILLTSLSLLWSLAPVCRSRSPTRSTRSWVRTSWAVRASRVLSTMTSARRSRAARGTSSRSTARPRSTARTPRPGKQNKSFQRRGRLHKVSSLAWRVLCRAARVFIGFHEGRDWRVAAARDGFVPSPLRRSDGSLSLDQMMN